MITLNICFRNLNLYSQSYSFSCIKCYIERYLLFLKYMFMYFLLNKYIKVCGMRKYNVNILTSLFSILNLFSFTVLLFLLKMYKVMKKISLNAFNK